MAAPATLVDLVQNLDGFHRLDSCKDAISATTSILNNPPLSDPVLFRRCMNVIYGTDVRVWPCASYSTILGRFEDEKENALKQIPGVLIKQINRLDYPESYGQVPRDTKLPMSITHAIRDSGRGPKEFKKDIKILYNPSDFTDPSSRTSIVDADRNGEEFELYPVASREFRLDKPIFDKLLGVGNIINYFSATINADNTCDIGFEIVINRTSYRYTSRIGANLNAIPGHPPIAGTESAAEFFTGNPTKNKWFNVNKTNVNTETIKKGVCYIICKEFFGDIMIALFGLYYKVNEPEAAKKAAVFTGDNALTAVCKAWKVNFVSKNWKQTSETQECVAVLFNASLADELRANKEKLVRDIIVLNESIRTHIKTIIETSDGTSIKDVGNLNIFHKTLLKVMDNYIESINRNISTLTSDEASRFWVSSNGTSLVEFEKYLKLYKVAPFIRSSRPIIFARSISNPFKFIPGININIKGEFVTNLQRLRNVQSLRIILQEIVEADELTRILQPASISSAEEAPVVEGHGRMRRSQHGGTRRKRKYKQRGGTYDDLEDSEALREYQENEPTRTLKMIIAHYIEDNYVEDIYNHLYFLFDINCVVCYNLLVLKILIMDLSRDTLLSTDLNTLNYKEWIDYYNYLIKNRSRPLMKKMPFIDSTRPLYINTSRPPISYASIVGRQAQAPAPPPAAAASRKRGVPSPSRPVAAAAAAVAPAVAPAAAAAASPATPSRRSAAPTAGTPFGPRSRAIPSGIRSPGSRQYHKFSKGVLAAESVADPVRALFQNPAGSDPPSSGSSDSGKPGFKVPPQINRRTSLVRTGTLPAGTYGGRRTRKNKKSKKSRARRGRTRK
jgi:hypothetical protein